MRRCNRRYHILNGCKADERIFFDVGVVFPKDSDIKKYEPELAPLLAAYHGKAPNSRTNLCRHIDANWVVNATMIDPDWEAKKDNSAPPNMAEPPLEFPARIYGSEDLPPVGRQGTVITQLSFTLGLVAM